MTTTPRTAEQLKSDLLAYRFPPGSLRVLPYEDWLARDCIGAFPAEDGLLHPAWTLIGTFRGMGVDLSELFTLVGAADEDGVMFGETEIDQFGTLEIGRNYVVSGRFVDVERRSGRKIGTFDLVTFEVTIDNAGTVITRCRNSLVVPRRDNS
ncbi:hypothetical protein [Rhodococcus koreensis]